MPPGPRTWFAVGLALALAACATKPDRQAFNADAHRDVRRILILEPVQKSEILAKPPHLVFAGGQHGVTLLLMLPLSAAINVDNEAKSKAYSELAVRAGFDLDDQLATKLADDLARKGFAVSRRKVERQTFNWPFDGRAAACENAPWPTSYATWRDSADAVLDVRLLPAGFARLGNILSEDYTLYAGACVRLIDTRTQATRYRETFVIHGGVSFGAGTFVPSESGQFADFDDLVKRHDVGLNALREAMYAVA